MNFSGTILEFKMNLKTQVLELESLSSDVNYLTKQTKV